MVLDILGRLSRGPIIRAVAPRTTLALLLGLITLSDVVSSQPQGFGASRTALATVVDARGRSIVDVEIDDFVVRETGQAREVLSVRVADYPVAVVLDNGPGAGQDFVAIRQAAARFIGRVGRRPISVALAGPPHLIATLDDDRAAVARALDNAAPGLSGDGLFEAIVESARSIAESGSSFSAIVVVSASPLASVPPELLTPILGTGAVVYVVVAGSAQAGQSTDALRALADQTGGQFTTVFSAASYPVALDRLADRLAPQLLLEYVVPTGSTSGNDVQLGVRIPGARVIGLGVK